MNLGYSRIHSRYISLRGIRCVCAGVTVATRLQQIESDRRLGSVREAATTSRGKWEWNEYMLLWKREIVHRDEKRTDNKSRLIRKILVLFDSHRDKQRRDMRTGRRQRKKSHVSYVDRSAQCQERQQRWGDRQRNTCRATMRNRRVQWFRASCHVDHNSALDEMLMGAVQAEPPRIQA